MKLNLKRIKHEMKWQKLSQADVARLLECHEQWVSDILKGKVGRTFRTVKKLASALHVMEKDLVE